MPRPHRTPSLALPAGGFVAGNEAPVGRVVPGCAENTRQGSQRDDRLQNHNRVSSKTRSTSAFHVSAFLCLAYGSKSPPKQHQASDGPPTLSRSSWCSSCKSESMTKSNSERAAAGCAPFFLKNDVTFRQSIRRKSMARGWSFSIDYDMNIFRSAHEWGKTQAEAGWKT